MAIKEFFNFLFRWIKKRVQENNELKEIERKAYLEERKRLAAISGKNRANKINDRIFRF